MRISELLSYMNPRDWVWVANRHGQVYYGWAMHVPESVGDLEVGTVSGDQNIEGVIDIYIKEERCQ
jgi:hypothetical protein